MKLGLEGRKAIICASSRGLGRACAEALAAEGVHIVINGREATRMNETADEIRRVSGSSVSAVAADITTEAGRRQLLEACPEPDILVNNNGGPTPVPFLDASRDHWIAAVEANMIAPLMLVRGVLEGMKMRNFGRIINITSAMVTTPRSHMCLSSGPRAGLTAALKGVAIEVARHNITINNLLPERFNTDRQQQMAQVAMKRDNISYEVARERQAQSIAAKRLGEPKEFGAACAFLCSDLAGYISGQNLHLDGGSYPALI